MVNRFIAGLRAHPVRTAVALAAALLVAIAGYWVVVSRAAGSFASLEVEDGTGNGQVMVGSDAAASGGKYLQFAAAGQSPNPGTAGFVAVCGMQLCLNGKPFVVHGATTYGQLDDPAKEVALAKDLGLNVLEIVHYERTYRSLAETMSEATWTRVDAFIAAAKQQDIRIVLNLSSYSQSLQAAGRKPTTTDWQPFLQFVANRVNTKTGITYKEEPAIAMVKLVGEIDAPNYSVSTRGTTAETTAFFKRTLAQWKALDKNHLVSTGGFSYINDANSGIDWKTIMADANNDMCDIEINSYPDRNISVPAVASYCKQIGKPWFLAAWSACLGAKDFADDINHWPNDTDMAAHARAMYAIARNDNPAAPAPAIAAVGTNFWNLGAVPARQGSCDIGPQFPLTQAVVKSYAP